MPPVRGKTGGGAPAKAAGVLGGATALLAKAAALANIPKSNEQGLTDYRARIERGLIRKYAISQQGAWIGYRTHYAAKWATICRKGTILKWLKSEGESVQNGEPIAEIETDKAVVEFESYADGVVQAILVSAGTTVPVGEPIAVVGDAVDAAPPADAPADEPVADAEQPADDEPAEQPSAAIPMPAAAPIPVADDPAPEPAAPLRASPVARRIADERGVNIADVVGTGPWRPRYAG